MLRFIVLLAGVNLACPLTASAQDNGQSLSLPTGDAPVLRSATDPNSTASRTPELKMYEDIEVMRRILETGLHRVSRLSSDYLSFTNALKENPKGAAIIADLDNDGWPDIYVANDGRPQIYPAQDLLAQRFRDLTGKTNPHAGIAPPETVEGFYLKGHGVVFNAALAASYQEAGKQAPPPAIKPITEWERVRRELRGEKVEAAPKPAATKHDSLSDVVLKLLAENGHNFTQLPENEQVVVAVTLRRGQDCMLCHTPNNLRGPQGTDPRYHPGSIWGTFIQQDKNDQQHGMTATRRAAAKALEPLAQKQAGNNSVNSNAGLVGRVDDQFQKAESQNLVLLGDLEMKQHRYKEAMLTYRKAYEDQQTNPPYGFVSSLIADARDGNLKIQQQVSAVELASKWAQASLAADDPAQASQAFKKIADNSGTLNAAATNWIQSRGRPTVTAPAKSSALALPNKLIISAPKKLLDQIAAGKISLEEFKNGVNVQLLTFSQQ